MTSEGEKTPKMNVNIQNSEIGGNRAREERSCYWRYQGKEVMSLVLNRNIIEISIGKLNIH